MDFSAKYTTADKKALILNDEKSSPELKESELKKEIVSNDAFALGEVISDLSLKIEKVRLSFIR